MNYRTEAGLYHPVKRSLKPSPVHIVYKRFKTAAVAIRLRLRRFRALSWPPPHWKSATTAMTPSKFASYMTPARTR